MANNFIQETVSREIMVAERNASIVRQYCMTDVEGEIQEKGTSVKLNILSPVELKDTKDNPVSRDADDLNSEASILKITEDKNYKFKINHKDIAEGMPTGMFSKSLVDVGTQIAREADKLVLSKYTEITDTKHIMETKAVDKDNIYDTLIDIDTEMDTLEISQVGRVIFVHPYIANLLAKDTIIRQAKEQNFPRGYVTTVGNLVVVKSNDVKTVNKADGTLDYFACMAGVAGKTFAHAYGFTENKVVESQYLTDGFHDVAMGQVCSGAKIVMPKYAFLAKLTR